jgi:hypothetical protein
MTPTKTPPVSRGYASAAASVITEAAASVIQTSGLLSGNDSDLIEGSLNWSVYLV